MKKFEKKMKNVLENKKTFLTLQSNQEILRT